MDLETAYDHDIGDQRSVLEKLRFDLQSMGLPISIFTTSESAEEFKPELINLKRSGNAICCHGFNHSLSENYRDLDELQTSVLIREATGKIENIIQDKLYSFRGPGFSTSSITQKVLIENGYKCDYSVCSQRIDFMNSTGGRIEWIFSPRKPYHPSSNNPYKKGNSPLWVVPLSSIGLPFISGLLYIFGLSFMKSYLRFLIYEAIKTGKPIVYLFHSYEFCRYTGQIAPTGKTLDRAPRKFIHRLYSTNHAKRYYSNLKLLKYMVSLNSSEFFTANNYAEHLECK